VSGAAGNAGCPVATTPPDGDGDGVPDASDSCPKDPGPAGNFGCPDRRVTLRGDLGITCGTSRIAQLDLNVDTPSYRLAADGAQSCFFLVSNRAANELIDLAKRYNGDIASAFYESLGNPWVRSFVADAVRDAALEQAKRTMQSLLIKVGLRVLAGAAPRVGIPASAAYFLGNWVKQGGRALTALATYAIYKGVREHGSCVAFEIYERTGQPPQLDYDVLLSPRMTGDADTDPSVWEHTDDGVRQRLLNLHCASSTGEVTRVNARDTSLVLQSGWDTIIVGSDLDAEPPARATSTEPDVSSQPDGSVIVGLTAERTGRLTVELRRRGANRTAGAANARVQGVLLARKSRRVRRTEHVLLRLRAHGRTAKGLRRGAAVPARIHVKLRSGRRVRRSATRITLRDVCATQPTKLRDACRRQ
jgi:hypothetical protein